MAQQSIKVKVTPKARSNEVVGFEGDELKVKVMAPPDKGEANRAVIRLLAEHFKIPSRDVILLKGETSRHKVFLLMLPENPEDHEKKQ